MSQTISGYLNTVQRLSPARPVVTLNGTINAYGSIATYTVNVGAGPSFAAIDAAVFAPASGFFTITNQGLVESIPGDPANFLDAGIVLGGTGEVLNTGTVLAPSGIIAFGTLGSLYVHNTGRIAGSAGASVVQFGTAAVTLANSGTLSGPKAGVFLAGAALVSNASAGFITSTGGYGVDVKGAATVTNDGTISGFYGGINLEDVPGLVRNTGLVAATGTGTLHNYVGIKTGEGGSVLNAGTITGQNGIAVQYNFASAITSISLSGYVENSGVITALSSNALAITLSNGTYSNTLNFGTGIALNLPGTAVNTGLISASNAGIYTQPFLASAVAENEGHGTIVSGGFGIELAGGGTASNAGSIAAATTLAGSLSVMNGFLNSGDGIALNIGAGTVNNTGQISGSHAGIAAGSSAVIFNAAGAGIASALGYGVILLSPDNSVSNAGAITGLRAGVASDSTTTLTNSGSITATASTFTTNGTGSGHGLPPGTYASHGVQLTAGGEVFNDASGVISGANGIDLAGGISAYVKNAGLVTGVSRSGIYLKTGGTVANTGTVQAYKIGIQIYDTGSVTNSGLVESAKAAGIYLEGIGHVLNTGTVTGAKPGIELLTGGVASNTSTGIVSGYAGIIISGSSYGMIDNAGAVTAAVKSALYVQPIGTIINSGTAIGGGHGIELDRGGLVENTGFVSGHTGAGLGGGATLVDSGTIIGTAGDAVSFASGVNNTLLLESGASFSGTVDGGDTLGAGFSVLEFGAGSGSFGGLGGSVIHFTTIDFGAGADWIVAGNSAGLADQELILGFHANDVLDLTGLTLDPGLDTIGSGGALTLQGGSGPVTLYFSQPAGGTVSLSSDGAGGTDIRLETNAPCFAAGTRIATPDGEVPVETLQIGDWVCTWRGPARRVKWLGQRQYDGRFIAGNHLILPVRIRAGAIAPGIPARDLVVSPGHAIFVGGMLVPAWRLIDGGSVTQAAAVERVDYFHIELDSHDILLAEGCPAESFLDDGSRRQFQNAGEFTAAEPNPLPVLPRVEAGFALAALRGIAARRRPAGELRGFVDQAGPVFVSGWAQDAREPERPVALDICAAGRRLGRVLANAYRADLRAAGLGSGCHGFTFPLPASFTGAVEVRRAADGAILALTEAARAA